MCVKKKIGMQINKTKLVTSYLTGFIIAMGLPQGYYRPLISNIYDSIYSSVRITEYDKYYKIL